MTTPPAGGGTPGPSPLGTLTGTNNLTSAISTLTRQMSQVTSILSRLATSGIGRANATMSALGYGPTGSRGTPSAFGLFPGMTSGQADAQRAQAGTLSNAHSSAYQTMQQQLQRQQLIWDRQRTMGQNALGRTGKGALSADQRYNVESQMEINADQFTSGQARTRQAFDQQVLTLNQMSQQASMSRRRAAVGAGMSVAGAAAGAIWSGMTSYYSGGTEQQIGMYGRRMSLMQPTTGGTAGTRAQAFASSAFATGAQNWATSDSDLFGGLTAINEQTSVPYRGTMTQQAAATAFVTPGMGIQGAAQSQAELGTARAFYASQMMGLTPTRTAGGQQTSMNAMAMSVANRVNRGSITGLSNQALQDELAQGGSLSTSLQAYGQAAGLSGQTLEAMRNQVEAMHALMTPAKGSSALSQQQAEDLITQASQGGKAGQAAYRTMQAHGLDTGDSYQDAQNLLAGKQRSGHLADSADFLDAAKASANSLADIYGLLQKAFGSIASLSGSLSGGGILGTMLNPKGTSKNPVEGLLVGGTGGLVGGLANWGKKMLGIGGGSSNAAGGSQSATPSGAGSGSSSGAASTAISWAETQLGKPYLWGGTGPDAWDCSGLTQAAFKAAGVNLPRTSQQQSQVGVEVPLGQAQPGDLIFYGTPGTAEHVGLVTGPDTVLEAPHTGTVVKFEKISQDSSWKFARRIAGSTSGSSTPASSNLAGGAPASSKTTQATRNQNYVALGSTSSTGSIEEVAALAAALSSGAWSSTGGDTGQSQNTTAGNSTSSSSPAASTALASSGSFDFSAIQGKYGTIPSPPSDIQAAILQGMAAASVSGPDWARGMMTLTFRESGYDPKAQNNTDSNAKAGHPSIGIAQTIEPTFEAYRVKSLPDDPTNAAADVAADIGYIKSRYGSIANVQQANPDKPPLGYDRGAWDVPADQVANLHKGEQVLTKQQATTLRQALMNGGVSPSAQSGVAPSINFAQGAIVIQMPSATSDGAQQAAKSFVDFVAADSRVKTLMGGW